MDRIASLHLPRPHAILFDLGNTVLEEQRFELDAGIAAVVKESAAVADLTAAFRLELAEHHRHHRELRLAQWLCDRVPTLASAPLDDVEDTIWRVVVTLAPRPGIAHVLERLSGDGIPIAAVSNAFFSSRVLSTELARHDLARHFRFVLSSADCGTRKPGVEIFERALAMLDTPAERTWLVGDTLQEDMAGARAAGLEPVWFSNGRVADDLFADISSVGSWKEFTDLYDDVQRLLL